jgi:hypothetical protein
MKLVKERSKEAHFFFSHTVSTWGKSARGCLSPVLLLQEAACHQEVHLALGPVETNHLYFHHSQKLY